MPPRVYIETSVLSYLTAPQSRDVIAAARQHLTRRWWETRRWRYQLFSSELVQGEAERGNQEAAKRRISFLEGLPLLISGDRAKELADALVLRGPLPAKAKTDALHIAVAAVYGMDYLLTWNCKHIANAEMRAPIERICEARGYTAPMLCTPEALMGEEEP